MKKAVMLLVLVLLLTAIAGTSFVKKARAETITVPDDYATIQDAINAATEGDTVFVKKGTYEGPINQTLVINKSLSLIGEDVNNTIINLHPPYNETWIITQVFYSYYNAISIDANDVRLANFTITITRGGDISVNGNRTQIIGNNITTVDITTGIRVKSFFNVIVSNSVWSIFLDDANSNIISNNTCGYLQLGYANKTSSYNIISGNKIEAGTRSFYGIMVGTSSHNVFYGNYIANCRNDWEGFGVAIGGEQAENNTFYHNTFINNNKHVDIYKWDLSKNSAWDNGKEGNYWDDYNGTDSNKDGIGDTPYVINENNQDNYPLMAPFDISSVTVELPDWASPVQSPSPCPSIEPDSASSPLTALVVALVITVTVEGIGLLIYFKKRKR
jgi:nitrous oxidase accessory protein